MTIEIGVFLPASTPDQATPILGDIAASARHAEDLGLDAVWTADHLIPTAPLLESTTVLAAAAAVTERIRVGFGVMVLSLRPTAWAAKQISALQHVSGNRLELGVGTGNPAHGDIAWRAVGASFEDRGRHTDEALRLLPSLIAGRPTTLPDGTEATLAPGATVPPLLIAGKGPKALRRAAEFGDAWIGISESPEAVAATLTQLTDLAAAYDRPTPYAVVVAPQLPEDPNQAATQLAAYAKAGTRRVILVPAPGTTDWRRAYEHAATLRAALAAFSG